VGARKLGLYGEQVLALLAGDDVETVLEKHSLSSKSDE